MSASHSAPYALVVDDDHLIRMDVADILEEAGFQTFEADHVAAAIDRLVADHARIVLLFTDVHMPGGRDGFSLARETARRWPHIAIVVASGQAQPGADDMPPGACFLPKPFSAQLVHTHLKTILPDGCKPEPLRH